MHPGSEMDLLYLTNKETGLDLVINPDTISSVEAVMVTDNDNVIDGDDPEAEPAVQVITITGDRWIVSESYSSVVTVLETH